MSRKLWYALTRAVPLLELLYRIWMQGKLEKRSEERVEKRVEKEKKKQQ
jgi:hypothetical protein